VPRPDRLDPTSHGHVASEASGGRRLVAGATLVTGSAILAGTLAAPSGSALFFVLGLLAAVTWIVGAVLAGPTPPLLLPPRRGPAGILAPLFVGAALFGAFFVARLLAEQIPFLSGSVTRVLARADAGPRPVVLLVALVNGVGEELFFRGALPMALGKHHGAVWATILYCLVTVCTLNVALVAAAVVMGTVLMVERQVTAGVVAPVLTHLSWSTLVIFLLPR
jgi:membrane protease YdiL (CAAX protease family)